MVFPQSVSDRRLTAKMEMEMKAKGLLLSWDSAKANHPRQSRFCTFSFRLALPNFEFLDTREYRLWCPYEHIGRRYQPVLARVRHYEIQLLLAIVPEYLSMRDSSRL